MANVIGQTHKFGKQNRKESEITTDPSKALSTHSNSHEKLNENIDIKSKKSLNAETNSCTNSDVKDKPS